MIAAAETGAQRDMRTAGMGQKVEKYDVFINWPNRAFK